MDKLTEFKEFVKTKPFLASEVKNGKITWQTLYETYDIFGAEHEFFQEKKEENPKGENTDDQFGRFIKSVQKLDTKKISDGLDNIKKVVGMIDEFRPTLNNMRTPTTRIKPFRRYND